MASITCRSRASPSPEFLVRIRSHAADRSWAYAEEERRVNAPGLGLASLGLQRGARVAILKFTGVPGNCRNYPPGSPLARHFISLESVAPRELDFESLVRDDASGLDQTLRVQADDLAWLFYTWRTTGRPVCRSDVWLQMIRGFEHHQPDLLDPPSKRDTVAG